MNYINTNDNQSDNDSQRTITNHNNDDFYSIFQFGSGEAVLGNEEPYSNDLNHEQSPSQLIDFTHEYQIVQQNNNNHPDQYIVEGIANFDLNNQQFYRNQESTNQRVYVQQTFTSRQDSSSSRQLIELTSLQNPPVERQQQQVAERAHQPETRRLNSSGNSAEGNSSSSSSSLGDYTPIHHHHHHHHHHHSGAHNRRPPGSSPYNSSIMRNAEMDEAKWPQALDQGSSRPYVEIVEQPSKCALRFRYKCEGRSAGSLPGVNSNGDNKTYPAIKIHNYVGKAVVVISCVTKDAPYRTHPHNIVGKEGCKRGICTIVLNNEPDMVRSFPSLGIQCVKRKDIAESLTIRESIKVDPFRLGFEHKHQGSDIDLNAVRLCFQVFITSSHQQKCDVPLIPVVSDPIHDKKAMSDLVITKLSHHAAPATGGREVIILCDRVPKDDIQIKFYEERNNEVVWETYVDVAPTDVHKQVAISFRTPKYRDEHITQNVMARIQLRRISDNALSEPRIFQFLHCESDEDILSRKRRKIQQFNLNHCALENILTVNAASSHQHHHLQQPADLQQQQSNQMHHFQHQQQQPVAVQLPMRFQNTPQIHQIHQQPQQMFAVSSLQSGAQACMIMQQQQVPQINNQGLQVQQQQQQQQQQLQHPQPQPRRSRTSSPQSQRVSPIPAPQQQQQQQPIQMQNQPQMAATHQTLNTLTVPNTNNVNQNCGPSASPNHSPSPGIQQPNNCLLAQQQNGYPIDTQNLVVRGHLIDKDGKLMQLVARPETHQDQQQEQVDANQNQNIRPLDSSLDRIRISELMPDMTFNTNLEY